MWCTIVNTMGWVFFVQLCWSSHDFVPSVRSVGLVGRNGLSFFLLFFLFFWGGFLFCYFFFVVFFWFFLYFFLSVVNRSTMGSTGATNRTFVRLFHDSYPSVRSFGQSVGRSVGRSIRFLLRFKFARRQVSRDSFGDGWSERPTDRRPRHTSQMTVTNILRSINISDTDEPVPARCITFHLRAVKQSIRWIVRHECINMTAPTRETHRWRGIFVNQRCISWDLGDCLNI